MVIAGVKSFSDDDETDAAEVEFTAGMTAEQREAYEGLSPEGKEYVNREMEKFDEYCSQTSDC
ncbi:hypothetical protein [Qipengyuania sediminis]|uniref:hypothetical protein n=1 Tax=Qipengyuania sediminis TaxID=1532023 RepID=UPI00105A5E35|nr:hypothetical protein [Qipengyuania sediminis]